MSSRDFILNQLPGDIPGEVPRWSKETAYTGDLTQRFQQVAVAVGSSCELFSSINEVKTYIETHHSGLTFFSQLKGLMGTLTLKEVTQGQAELVVLNAKWGVAENGAVWLDDSVLPHRVLPFYTEHLIVLLSVQNILADMHIAYQKVPLAMEGFGLWVSGPSKTADIEQALVVGAQGPKTFLIALLP